MKSKLRARYELRKWAQEGEWWIKYWTDTTCCALTKKEETYYRTFDGRKSKIDLTLPHHHRRGKGSFHVATTEMEQGRANLTQFRKESTITTKVHNQNTIEETHSCLVKTILQAAEKNILGDKKKTNSSMVE